jgi:hypothetical protein
MSALVKVGDGKYATQSGTWTAERCRYRDDWGQYQWGYELSWWRSNFMPVQRWWLQRLIVSNPYSGRPRCKTLAQARAIVNRYEKAAA